MAQILKQSTAVDVLVGPFVDISDGATAETGESPSVKLSKNGQALAAKSDVTTPVHDADGYYNCELDATDTNTIGTLVLTVAASATALPVRHEYQVVEEAVYDDLFAGSADPFTAMQSDVAAIHSQTTVIESDTVKIESDTAVIESDTTAIHSDTTIIASDVVIVVSDTTAIHSQTTVIESDTVVISSDTAAIHSDTTIIASDVVLVYSDTAAIHSDTTIIASDVVLIYSDTTVIASDVVVVVSDTTAIHSQTTVIESDSIIVSSDVALLEAAQSEPSAVPAANASPLDKLAWLTALSRNKVTQTSSTLTLRNDADGANIGTSTVSDDGTTATRGKFS